jgi:hypothetical protein
METTRIIRLVFYAVLSIVCVHRVTQFIQSGFCSLPVIVNFLYPNVHNGVHSDILVSNYNAKPLQPPPIHDHKGDEL